MYKSVYLFNVYSTWHIKLWVCYVTYVLVVHCQGPPIMQKKRFSYIKIMPLDVYCTGVFFQEPFQMHLHTLA